MTVPTTNQLATALYDLERLAHDDPDQFHLIAAILDKLQWGHHELTHHKTQAGWKRSSEVAPVGAGGGSSVEAQFSGRSTPTRMYPTDPMVRALQQLRGQNISRLGRLDLDLDDAARKVGYPHRSAPEGSKVG